MIIDQARDVALWGRIPDWHHYLAYTAVAFCIAIGGHFWFRMTEKGFADVL